MLATEASATGAAFIADALAPDVMAHLERDVASFIEAFDAGYEPPSRPGSLTSGTFWMPTRDMRAAGPFRNGVERAIASLARARAVRDAGVRVFADDESLESENIEGAEWWIQDVARDEPPKTFHTDCDAVVMESGEDTNAVSSSSSTSRAGATEIVHPAVASVLYVGTAGGPTAVFGQRKKNARLFPRYPSEVAVAHPRRNTLLLFEGDRYHAVMHPSETNRTYANDENELEGFKTQRITVLVNWWRERPRGPCDLPDRFVTPPFVCHESESTKETNSSVESTIHTTTTNIEPTLTQVPVLHVPYSFVEHADAWRKQTVPQTLLSPKRLYFVARYLTAPPSLIEPETETSVDFPEWPFEDEHAS